MNVYRYINNTDTDIVAGPLKIPAHDELSFTVAHPEFDKFELVRLVDGVRVDEPIEHAPSIAPPQQLELHAEEVVPVQVYKGPTPVVPEAE